jgi:hypothetical protein
MPELFKSIASHRPRRLDLRKLSFGALRIAPWVVFGPITGCMSEAAVAAYKRGRPLLAGFYVLANIGVLVALPVLTAMVAGLR